MKTRSFSLLLVVLLSVSFIGLLFTSVPNVYANSVLGSATSVSGTTTVGSSSVVWLAGPYTASTTGNITSIHVFCKYDTSQPNVVAAIYSDNGGSPGNLLSSSSVATLVDSATYRWYDFPITSVQVTSGQSYWIGTMADANYLFTGSSNFGAISIWTKAATYPTFPSSAGSGSLGPASSQCSIYANIFSDSFVVSNVSARTIMGSNTTFSAKWTTNETLLTYTFGSNQSGVFTNSTPVSFSSAWSNITGNYLSRVITGASSIIQWQIWAVTTLGYWRTTGLQSSNVVPSIYTITGPYYESGSVGPNTTVTVYYTSGFVESLSLNGSLGTAQTLSLNPNYVPLYITWNVSSSYLRTYYYNPLLTSEDALIFIPDTSVAILSYSFYVADFYGMDSPYLSSSIAFNGTNHVVERVKANINPITFMMQQWYYYTLTYTCTQGTYSHGFHAETTFSQNDNILSGMFPAANYTSPLSAHANRFNSTRITATYQNTNGTTDWLYFNITHRSGLSTIVDYGLNVSSNSYTLNWDNAIADVSYIVSIQASVNGTVTGWRYPATAIPVSANPFSGMFSALGTWPVGFDADQLPAAIIILCILAVFSYSSAGVGAVLSFIVGGVLIVLGWFTPNLQVFGFSGFVALVLGFLDAKRTEREL
jgi:hypothetical protein